MRKSSRIKEEKTKRIQKEPVSKMPEPVSKMPRNTLELLWWLLIGLLKSIPKIIKKNLIKLLILLAVVIVVVMVINTYLLVVRNEGFAPTYGNPWLDITALRGNIAWASTFWLFASFFITSTYYRIREDGAKTFFFELAGSPVFLVEKIRDSKKEGMSVSLITTGAVLLLLLLVKNRTLLLLYFFMTLLSFTRRQRSFLVYFFSVLRRDIHRIARAKRPVNPATLYLMTVSVAVAFLISYLAFRPLYMIPLAVVFIAAGIFLTTNNRNVKTSMIFIGVIALNGLYFSLFGRVLADDGGWSEAGGTLSGWIRSPGAGTAVIIGVYPGVSAGVGVAAGIMAGGLPGTLVIHSPEEVFDGYEPVTEADWTAETGEDLEAEGDFGEGTEGEDTGLSEGEETGTESESITGEEDAGTGEGTGDTDTNQGGEEGTGDTATEEGTQENDGDRAAEGSSQENSSDTGTEESGQEDNGDTDGSTGGEDTGTEADEVTETGESSEDGSGGSTGEDSTGEDTETSSGESDTENDPAAEGQSTEGGSESTETGTADGTKPPAGNNESDSYIGGMDKGDKHMTDVLTNLLGSEITSQGIKQIVDALVEDSADFKDYIKSMIKSGDYDMFTGTPSQRHAALRDSFGELLDDMKSGENQLISDKLGAGLAALGMAFDAIENSQIGDDAATAISKSMAANGLSAILGEYLGSEAVSHMATSVRGVPLNAAAQLGLWELGNTVLFGNTKMGDIASPGKMIKGSINAVLDVLGGMDDKTFNSRLDKNYYGENIKNLVHGMDIAEDLTRPGEFYDALTEMVDIGGDGENWDGIHRSVDEIFKLPDDVTRNTDNLYDSLSDAASTAFSHPLDSIRRVATDAASVPVRGWVKIGEMTAYGGQALGEASVVAENAIYDAADTLSDAVSDAAGTLSQGIDNAVDNVSETMSDMGDSFNSFFNW